MELTKPRYRIVGERERFDERDNVQARLGYVPGTPEYDDFYRRHPEWKAKDDEIRRLPGIGAVGDPLDLPFMAAQMDALIRLGFEDRVDGPVAPPTRMVVGHTGESALREICAERATEKVKGFAEHLGAELVRVGPLNPLNVYTNVGKPNHDPARRVGQPIECTHQNAISLAVGIQQHMVETGPVLPELVEVLRVYERLATVAVDLAAYIRALGYPARAHVLTNYQVLCVPTAIDAGMGELGRHGLMITKELGAAFKLATVTTDLPLVHDPPRDVGVPEFCGDCKICAQNCPSGAISQGKPKVLRGVERWAINPEACFRIWNETGTDCGVCIACCPWSNPRTLFHRTMTEIASRKHRAGWWMSWGDKIFYGRFKPIKPPSWLEQPTLNWEKYRRDR